MRRCEFIARLGAAGANAAVPRAARAQQDTRVRRLAILMQLAGTPGFTALLAAIRNDLAKLGWVEGRNLQIDVRYAQGDIDRMRANAAEPVGLAPDVIFAGGITMAAIVQQRTQTIPIVFGASDALAVGLVKNPAHPERNTAYGVDKGSPLSWRCHLCRSHLSRCKAGRSPCSVSYQVRVGHQPEGRQGDRAHGSNSLQLLADEVIE